MSLFGLLSNFKHELKNAYGRFLDNFSSQVVYVVIITLNNEV